MTGLFEAFEVYNKKKHAPGNYKVHGTNHSNISGGTTTFMYSQEHREPRIDKLDLVKQPSSEDSSRKSSVSEEGLLAGAVPQVATMPGPQMVDMSKMSRDEFEAMYNKLNPATLRKGEPNNKVNF